MITSNNENKCWRREREREGQRYWYSEQGEESAYKV